MEMSTRRLMLRPVEAEDIASMYEYAIDERVAVPAGFISPRSISKTRKNIRQIQLDWKKSGLKRMAFSIISKREKTWVGTISLRWPHGGLGEIGYGIHPRHWGKGYATEAARKITALAFEKFGAHRVQATCWVKNAGSARVLSKAGFKKEGQLRGYLKRADTVRDEIMFGMTRVDWRSLR